MGIIMKLLPYYIPYNISDHIKPITLINVKGDREYTSVTVDFDDSGGVIKYDRNFDKIQYVYSNTGTHNIKLSAYHNGGIDIQTGTINIYDNFDMYDTTTFVDYVSSTTNNYNLPNHKRSLIQSNDWVVADNINNALYALYENFEYIESLCHRPDIRGKETLISWLGGDNLSWYNIDNFLLSNNNNDFIITRDYINSDNNNNLIEANVYEDNTLSSGYLDAVGFDNIVDIVLQDDDHKGNNIYLIDGSSVVSLSSDINAALLLSSHNIQFNKTFNTPNSIDVDSIGNVYVADVGNNEVYKFKVVRGKLILQNSIGGHNQSNPNYKFIGLSHVKIDSTDRILVLDKLGYNIKVYDNLAGWIQTISIDNSKGVPNAFCINKKNDSIVVVTSNRWVLTYDRLGNLISQTSFSYYMDISNISQCFIDHAGNYLYVVGGGAMYKFTKDGLFLKRLYIPETDNTTKNRLVSGRCDTHNQTFIASKSKVFRLDSTPPLMNIKPFTPSSYYNFDSIRISSKEGVEDWVYNRAVKRLIHNHIIQYNNIHSRYVRGVSSSNKLQYFDMVNALPGNDINFDNTTDFIIGVNEPVLSGIVNRVLTSIYDKQKEILDYISPQVVLVYTDPPSLP